MIVVTDGLATVLAFLAVGLLLFLAHALIATGQRSTAVGEDQNEVPARRRGIKALVIGADGRASTSKLQAVLWTFAVFYAFVFLLVWGRSLGCDETGLSASQRHVCNQAARNRTSFVEVAARDLQAEYYVLLGFPLGVAVAAKALTSSKVAAGTLTKEEASEESTGVTQGLREVISNDRGETDLLDFQYFVFNLVALGFFWIEFLTKPSSGLPDLPATLVGLAGLSAAAYTTRKALQEDVKPAISSVIPRRITLAEGAAVAVIGTGFGDRRVLNRPGDEHPPTWVAPRGWVRLDGTPLKVTGWTSTRIDAALTSEVVAGLAGAGNLPRAAELLVDVADGPPSEPAAVELFRGP